MQRKGAANGGIQGGHGGTEKTGPIRVDRRMLAKFNILENQVYQDSSTDRLAP